MVEKPKDLNFKPKFSFLGTLHFEANIWAEAMKAFNAAKAIYEKLASTLNEEEAASYQSRIDEIAPSLRYCAYNIGDKASAKQDLLAMRGGQCAKMVEKWSKIVQIGLEIAKNSQMTKNFINSIPVWEICQKMVQSWLNILTCQILVRN